MNLCECGCEKEIRSYSRCARGHNQTGKEPWNKGLTKESDERVKTSSIKYSKTMKEKFASGEIEIWNKGKRCVQLGWNKGKTKETDERVKKISIRLSGKRNWKYGLTSKTDIRVKNNVIANTGKKRTFEQRKNMSESKKGKKLSAVHRENIKQTLIAGYKSGRIKARNNKYIKYRDYIMKSSWEVKVARWLDNHNINWEYETKYYSLHENEKKFGYIPDFYLPSYDLIIEIKGYMNGNRALDKWNLFSEQYSTQRKALFRYEEINNLDEIFFNLGISVY